MSARTQYLIEQIEVLRKLLSESNDPEKSKNINAQINAYTQELLENEKKDGNILLG